MEYIEKYNEWIKKADQKTKNELLKIDKDKKEIEERFYKDLDFGTGGLRGIIRAGTNGVNIYTIGKATQGLSNYINSLGNEKKFVAISFDSRKYSKIFALETAKVLAANNINVKIFKELKPVPELSFAVRELSCIAGVMITASHNPKEYNGYKVYWSDGGQLPPESASKVLSEIDQINNIFTEVKRIETDVAFDKGLIEYIDESVEEEYIKNVTNQSVIPNIVDKVSDYFKAVYTPLHGTGNVPVRKALDKIGFKNLLIVKEQELPDSDFPTVKSPNPEEKEGFELAIRLAVKNDADIVFGTDPDCDRVGVAVKSKGEEYKMLTGNQTGVLLTDYILSHSKLPKNPVVVKTIVTSEMARAICKEKDVAIVDVLTGFKFIGEKIKEFEKDESYNYVFGFEESYGYLAGTYARDKDAVVASMLIVEMACYYKSIGKSLDDALESLYKKYGYYLEELVSIVRKGKEGQENINKIMNSLRSNPPENIGDKKVYALRDYKNSKRVEFESKKEEKINLPVSDVLFFELDDGSHFVVRPSGTEPKIKLYFATKADSLKKSEKNIKEMISEVSEIIEKI